MRKITGEELDRIAMNFNRKNLSLPENSKINMVYAYNGPVLDFLKVQFKDVTVMLSSSEDYGDVMKKCQKISNKIHEYKQSDTRRRQLEKLFR